jgi:hypothetical protein
MLKNPIADTLFPLFSHVVFEVLTRSVVGYGGVDDRVCFIYLYSVACLRGSVEESQPSSSSGE